MLIDLATLFNVDKCFNKEILKKYLKLKTSGDIDITDKKIDELMSLKVFFKKIENLICSSTKIYVFHNFLKHEHDAFMIFKGDDGLILIDIEIKKNVHAAAFDQIKNHLLFFGDKISHRDNVALYGVTYCETTDECYVYKYLKHNSELEIHTKSFFAFILDLLNCNYQPYNQSLEQIKLLSDDLRDAIKSITSDMISHSNSENSLLKWIDSNLDNNDILVIDSEAGSGKTTIALFLFFKRISNAYLLLNNYRLRNSFFSEYGNYNWYKRIAFSENELFKKKFFYKECIIVDESQRLNNKQLNKILDSFKKIILFGDRFQVFEKKYQLNLKEFKNKKYMKKYKCDYCEYFVDYDRRFSKGFPSLIKFIFNNSLYKIKNKFIENINEKIFFYDNISIFLKAYNLCKDGVKKIFCEKNYQNEVCSMEIMQNHGFKVLIGKDNPTFSINNEINKIGTVYNAFSFEIDYVFVIVSSSNIDIINNTYLFNEIYTLCTRAKKELHLLILNNIEDYCLYCESYKNAFKF